MLLLVGLGKTDAGLFPNPHVLEQLCRESQFPLGSAESAGTAATSDAPSLQTTLEKTLGLRLVLTRGPVEVVVIDSIDHPSEN